MKINIPIDQDHKTTSLELAKKYIRQCREYPESSQVDVLAGLIDGVKRITAYKCSMAVLKTDPDMKYPKTIGDASRACLKVCDEA